MRVCVCLSVCLSVRVFVCEYMYRERESERASERESAREVRGAKSGGGNVSVSESDEIACIFLFTWYHELRVQVWWRQSIC